MSPGEVVRVAWEGLMTNRLRALLTMLGVIIGVAAVIVMVSVSAGTEAAIAQQINGLGANLLFVQASMSRSGPAGGGEGSTDEGLVYDDAVAIAEEVSGVAGVSVEQTTVQTIKSGNVLLESVSVVGTTADFLSVREVSVSNGRFIGDADVDRTTKIVVLGADIATELYGDANPIGEKVTVGDEKLTVVGVMAEKGLVGGVDYDTRVYVPLTLVGAKFMPSMFGRVVGERVNLIYVQVESKDDMEQVATQIQLLLARRKETTVAELPVTISTQDDIIATQESTTASFRELLGWVAGVSLIVGGIGIMNIMLVSVTERTREIGIRQAVGASPNDIRAQFLAEALFMSLVGGLIGVAAGIAGAWLFGQVGDMPTVVVPTSILLAFAASAAIGVFFGYYPANQAAQLDPIQALRHE